MQQINVSESLFGVPMGSVGFACFLLPALFLLPISSSSSLSQSCCFCFQLSRQHPVTVKVPLQLLLLQPLQLLRCCHILNLLLQRSSIAGLAKSSSSSSLRHAKAHRHYNVMQQQQQLGHEWTAASVRLKSDCYNSVRLEDCLLICLSPSQRFSRTKDRQRRADYREEYRKTETDKQKG